MTACVIAGIYVWFSIFWQNGWVVQFRKEGHWNFEMKIQNSELQHMSWSRYFRLVGLPLREIEESSIRKISF